MESFDLNRLIPETIDILVSSKMLRLPNQSGISLSLIFLNPLLEKKNELFSKKINAEQTKCINFETCGERTQMYCPNCDAFICNTCAPSHSTNIFSRHHHISKQHQSQNVGLRDDELGNLKKRYCPKHQSTFVSGFCFECSVFVCLCCLLESHDDHREQVNSLDVSVRKRRDRVVKIGVELESQNAES